MMSPMPLVDRLARAWAHRKLRRGKCGNCGSIIPDVRPVPHWKACSEECAHEMWVAAFV